MRSPAIVPDDLDQEDPRGVDSADERGEGGRQHPVQPEVPAPTSAAKKVCQGTAEYATETVM
jgi:hypothetical protein